MVNRFVKINTPKEPRFEITAVGLNFEIYHEPTGAIDTLSYTQLLRYGFTPSQLSLVRKKGTSYFQKNIKYGRSLTTKELLSRG